MFATIIGENLTCADIFESLLSWTKITGSINKKKEIKLILCLNLNTWNLIKPKWILMNKKDLVLCYFFDRGS